MKKILKNSWWVLAFVIVGYFVYAQRVENIAKARRDQHAKKIAPIRNPTMVEHSLSDHESIKTIRIPRSDDLNELDFMDSECFVYTNNRTNSTNMHCNSGSNT